MITLVNISVALTIAAAFALALVAVALRRASLRPNAPVKPASAIDASADDYVPYDGSTPVGSARTPPTVK